jgi:phage terminase small subunit
LLTAKQERFVQEYLIDLNATQAAIRAGYSAATAEPAASRLLRNVKVSEAIAAAQAERSERTKVKADDVLRELARIGFSDVMMHYALDDDGRVVLTEAAPQGASAAVASMKRKVRTFTREDGSQEVSVESEFKVWDKNTALLNIGRHLGMFTDRQEITGKDGLPLFKSFLGVDTDAV